MKVYGVFQFSPIGDQCLGIYDSLDKIESNYGKAEKLVGTNKKISPLNETKNAWVIKAWESKNYKYIAEIEINQKINIG